MPSIRRELETTRTARWYAQAQAAKDGGPWAERLRDYAALRTVLDEQAAHQPVLGVGGHEPPRQLPGLLKLVAELQHYAGAEPVYRRYRDKQRSSQVPRWAGTDKSIKPTAALLAEAKIAGFWRYRDEVLALSDETELTRADWAAAYLHALATWTAEDRVLAAYQPATIPSCVLEDVAVLAASCERQSGGQPGGQPGGRIFRLLELASGVVRTVVDGSGDAAADAVEAVRDEVARLLAPPPEDLASRILRSAAQLSERLASDGPSALAPAQAGELRTALSGLAGLLDG